MRDSDWFGMCCVFLLAGFSIGSFIGGSVIRQDYRGKAIKAGAAKWVLIDEYGNTEFKWNTEDAK